ncbi:MAG: transcriptional regulator [Clostridia bacterium]|nr:transcriptional regulator [Clostridia bacterium]
MDEINKEQFIFGSLFLLANRLQVIGDRWDPDITMKQWFLIVMIAQFGDTPPKLSEVAEFMGSSRQNVKQLALKLEERGFVNIQKDEFDNRAIRLRLTESCKIFFKNREDRENYFLEELYKDFSVEELDSLYKGMYRLSESIFRMDELSKGGFKI